MRTIRDPDDRAGRLFALYAPRLRAYARRQAAGPDADDLVAEAFVVALRRPEAVPADDAQAWAWLVGTVRRLAANHRRRRETRERYWEDVLREHWRPTASSPEEAVAEREACLAALTALSPADLELVLLVAWDGLTHAQAAHVLGIRPNAFAVRLHRVRRRLGDTTRSVSPLLAAVALED